MYLESLKRGFSRELSKKIMVFIMVDSLEEKVEVTEKSKNGQKKSLIEELPKIVEKLIVFLSLNSLTRELS